MRRILVVVAIAFGVLVLGSTLTAGHANATAHAQDAPERAVVFESFMRST